MLSYNNIIVTHNSLRNLDTFVSITNSFQDGTNVTNRIVIITTEDDVNYLVDGHHTVTAAMNAGVQFPKHLVKQERYSYLELNSHNIPIGYVTPYNPKIEVRKPDFKWFKQAILNIYNSGKPDWAVDCIHRYRKSYIETRKIQTIEQLLNQTQMRLQHA